MSDADRTPADAERAGATPAADGAPADTAPAEDAGPGYPESAYAGGAGAKELVERLIEYGWNARDLEKARDLLVDDAPPLFNNVQFTYRGADEILGLMSEYRTAYPQTQLIIQSHVVEGDTVVTHVSCARVNNRAPQRLPHDFTLTHQLLDGKIVQAQTTPEISQLWKPGARILNFVLSNGRALLRTQVALVSGVVMFSFLIFIAFLLQAEAWIDDWVAGEILLLEQPLNLVEDLLTNADNQVNTAGAGTIESDATNNTIQALQSSNELIVDFPTSTLSRTPVSVSERERLQLQHLEAQQMALKHLKLVKFFFSRLFAYLLTAFAISLISVLTLVAITRAGWSQAESHILTLFVTTTSLAIWFGTVPNVFSLSQNLEQNSRAYIQYTNLTGVIRSYAGTGALYNVSGQIELIEPAAFILHTERTLAGAFSLPVQLNPAAVPSREDMLRLFEVSIPSAEPTRISDVTQTTGVDSTASPESTATPTATSPPAADLLTNPTVMPPSPP